jgi:DNA-binding NarL/FixJ family response regulator
VGKGEVVPRKNARWENGRQLSSKQKQVLTLIRQGYRNGDIAIELHISERTVKWYISHLLEIFNAQNRTELAGMQSEPNDTVP